ncbi:MAG: TadE/TadG family type IV pilus assembly protein [Rhizobiaceae bacterium]
MAISKFLNSARLRLLCTVDRFRDETRGVAAVEFAFIAPIMILLFVGTIELSAGVSTNRKLSRLSSTVGDLITQSQSLTTGDIDNIMDVSGKIMYPYKDPLTIVVTGVEINSSGQAKVKWSRSEPTGHAKTVGTNYTVPTKIRKPSTFLVSARISTSYTPSFGWAHYEADKGVYFSRTPIAMSEELFLRPRIGASVELN